VWPKSAHRNSIDEPSYFVSFVMSTVDTKKRPREEAEGDARPSTSSIDFEVQADAKRKLPVYARKREWAADGIVSISNALLALVCS
jgi:hypothetical protein